MKMYKLAGAIFCFICVLTFVTDLGVVPISKELSSDIHGNASSGLYTESKMRDYGSQLNSSLRREGNLMDTLTSAYESIRLFVTALPLALEALVYATVGLPMLLQLLEFPASMIALITPIVWFIYVWAILQLFFGRDVEG